MIDDFRAIIAMWFYKLATAIHPGIIAEIEAGANALRADKISAVETPEGYPVEGVFGTPPKCEGQNDV